MKKFIINSSLFLLMGALITCVISFANKNLLIKTVYNPKYFTLSKDTHTLITGASDSKFSFNPEIIKNSCNASLLGENYFYSYYKIKFALEGNSQIKNIILSYSYAALAKRRDEAFSNAEKALNCYTNYFALLDEEGRRIAKRPTKDYFISLAKFYFGIPIEFYNILDLSYNSIFNNVDITKYPFWGSFQEEHMENLPFFKKFKKDPEKGVRWTIRRHFYLKNEPPRKSLIMINSLKKIVLLCKNRNIRLILITTPIVESYLKKVNPYYLNIHAATLKQMKEIYPEIEYYDYSSFISNDEYFLDGDHLNRTSANLFSREINRTIFK